MSRGARATRRERSGRGGVGAIREVAVRRSVRGERGRVRSQLGDLERDRCGALELPLQLPVRAGSVVASLGIGRSAERGERVVPRLRVRACERRGSILERQGLGRDSRSLFPDIP